MIGRIGGKFSGFVVLFNPLVRSKNYRFSSLLCSPILNRGQKAIFQKITLEPFESNPHFQPLPIGIWVT